MRLCLFILGAGKVGRALHREARAHGIPSVLRAARRGVSSRIDASLVVVAVRDRDVTPWAERLAPLVRPDAVAVHVAGALSPDALAPLRASLAGVAQMHPMIAFADPSAPPSVRGGHVHVTGDLAAVRVARRFASLVGMRPRTFAGLDPVAYHAAAGLVANGAAALAAAGRAVLLRAGVPPQAIPHMLGPLLRSVAENVESLGLPGALTGPVRRGDARAVAAHRATLTRLVPEVVPLYLAMTRAQLPLAREVGDAPQAAFDAIEEVLDTP